MDVISTDHDDALISAKAVVTKAWILKLLAVFIYIVDLTMSNKARLCLSNTPQSCVVSGGISCRTNSATLRCLLNF